MKEIQPVKERRKTVVHNKKREENKPRRNSAVFKGSSREFICNIQATIQNLLDQEDTNKDTTITIEDTGPKRYLLEMENGIGGWIEGNYCISTLLQELSLADINLKTIIMPEDRINEGPMERLTRLIKTCFWKNLRRVLDKEGIKLALIDTKIKLVEYYLYVPAIDGWAVKYYKEMEEKLREEGFKVKIVKISTDKTCKSGIFFEDTLLSRGVLCDMSPGLLSLSSKYFKLEAVPKAIEPGTVLKREEKEEEWHNPKIVRNKRIVSAFGPCPFYVPGGRFNEMYGWDSYFIAKGLIHSGDLAESMCIAENLRYQIECYGKILNANRTYYLFRGNPPLLSTLVDEIVQQLLPKERIEHKEWIESCVDAMIKEYNYFQKGYNSELSLTRHTPGGKGIPMETEEGHFFKAIRKLVPGAENWSEEKLNEYIEQYNKEEVTNDKFEEYLQNDRAVRESGHDTSKRVDGIASYLYTVDLNSLLYKTETDILRYREIPEIREVSQKRKEAINTLLWNGTGYYDYNSKTGTLSTYKGATIFYPLFTKAATKENADVLVKNISDLVGPGGILSGTKESCKLEPGEMQRQWDYPYGWAPHQIIAWIGLVNYNYTDIAKELALRWCTMLGRVFAKYNGVITEKYNIEQITHKVSVEYGNIGANIKYTPREGFGWTNSSWLIGIALLKEDGCRKLHALITLDQ
ncbi:alpha,alpha-trehalase [Nematocida sp. AWRm80]|nr:alpha,alpha-trehalase [Nematocida sp. AWRm80]